MKISRRYIKRLTNSLVYKVNHDKASLYMELKNMFLSEINKSYHAGFYEGLLKNDKKVVNGVPKE